MPNKSRTRSIECFILVGVPLGTDRESDLGDSAGRERSEMFDQLESALLRRTREWAERLAGGSVSVLDSVADRAKAARSTADVVVLLRPALVRLGPGHASDLEEDLENGCEVVIGPTLAGGWYLLAMRPGDPELIDSAGGGESGSAGPLLATARTRASLEVGLLRAERDLGSESDLRAAAADPLVDIEVTRLLNGIARSDLTGGQGFEPR